MPKLKVILVGEGNAGKTSLATRFVEGVFTNDSGNFAQDFKEKNMLLGGREITVECWDTGGQEKFRTVTASFYRDADVVMFCASCQEEAQFTALEDWLEQYKHAAENNNTDVALTLVLTKSDLGECTYHAAAKDWASKNKADLCITSAKTGEGVEKSFTSAITRVFDMRASHAVKPPPMPKKSGCTIL